uniref:Uncharacterized protein n=1 Tax=viral metagenome TaxID=1070528 RepID=A0A6M3J998_9ZZZZ
MALPYANIHIGRWGPVHYPPNTTASADVSNGTIGAHTFTLTTNSVPWTNRTFLSSAAATSDAIAVDNVLGYFSIQLSSGNATVVGTTTGSGSGTLTVDYLVSNDGTNFVDPSGIDNDITTGFTYNSGDGSDGEDLLVFSPPSCKWLKIRATNTNASGNITLSATTTIF